MELGNLTVYQPIRLLFSLLIGALLLLPLAGFAGPACEEGRHELIFSNTPIFTSSNLATFAENASGTVLDVDANDGDGGAEDAGITYSLSGTDAGDFSINENGLLTFNSTPDFGTPADDDTNNIYHLTVTADDGGATADQDITIVVTPVLDVNLNAQIKLGTDIDGVASGDESGGSVSLSADGSVMAIGAPIHDSGRGHVRILAWDGSDWVQQGDDIDGEAEGDLFGTSVSFSADGTVVAIGAPRNDGNGSNSGHVRMYKWNGSTWQKQGSDIDGESSGDNSGHSIGLSADGSVVAIGAPENGDDHSSSTRGHVRVYSWNGSDWEQRGIDIDGEAGYVNPFLTGDESGSSISLSADGSSVAIGATANSGAAGSFSGHVRVYVWDGDSWLQRGLDIDGESSGDESGTSVSLNSDGTIVAIGAPDNSSDSGHVRVFVWDGSAWSQRGDDIDGEEQYDQSGSSVSINADGTLLAVGSPQSSIQSSGKGHVRVFQWDGTEWKTVEEIIEGEVLNDTFGTAVSLSADGQTLAIGASEHDSAKGHVRVYDLYDPVPVITSATSVSINENTTGTVLDVIATDGDGGEEDENITYSLTPAGDNDLFSISAAGLVTFNTVPDFESPQDTDTDNIYEIEVNASDLSNTTKQTLFITVTNIAELPIFTSDPDVSFQENSTNTVLDVDANDGDGGADDISVTYTLAEGDDNDLFTISSTGSITFNSVPDFENPLDANSNNDYVLGVKATDGEGTTEQSLTITVTNEEELPVISTANAADFAENGTGTILDVNANDGDGGADDSSVTYSLSGTDEALFKIDDSGFLEFVSPPDFDNPLDADANNVYVFEVNATDGNSTTQQALTITVTDVSGNDAPIFTSNALTAYAENDTEVVLDVNANDGDGGSEDAGITYSLSGTDAAGFSISATGELNFNSAPDFDSPTDDNANNIYQLTITANDGEDSNHSTSQDITVVVYPENEETINGQVQLGVDIDSENSGDGFGASVSMSADGYTMAVGAPGNDDNGTGSGHVRVFTWNGSSWLQRGSDIDGESVGDGSGTSLSLSADGTILAIGAPNNDANGTFSGQVRVYFWDGSDWVQRGSDIDGEASADQSGSSVSLNADGTVLAIGAPNNDQNGADSGHVRVFTWDGSNWLQRGTAIGGESSGDRSGSSVSLSADGNMLAIGAPYNDGNGSNSGHTRVHNWNGTNWVQIGEDIDGEASGDFSGLSVSMDAAGENVAIGASGHNSFRGHARVFRWNSSGSWTQVFSDVNGNDEGDELGYSVSLSADGQVLAVGARDDSNGLEPGFVRVYRVSLGWEQKGADIEGEAIGDWFGSSIGLSGDGSFLAIGAQRNDDNGSSAGHVRTYQLVDKSPVITSSDEVSFSENGTGTVIDVDANDGDLGSVDTNITYSLTAGGDNDLFSISSTGLITFNATPDFESPQDADTDNIYEIEVNVADASNTTTQTVTVTVTDVEDFPVITSSTTASFAENGTGTVLDVVANDGDGGAEDVNVTYSLTAGGDNDLFSISSTGLITFNTAPDFESPEDADTGNDYVIEVNVADASNTTTQTVTVTVTNEEELPVISTANAADFAENGTGTILDVNANDGDGGADDSSVTYSLSGTDEALFKIDDSGFLEFVSPPDFDNPLDADANNVYVFEVNATDGNSTTQQALTITVTDVSGNDAPIFTSNALTAYAENDTEVVLDVNANDGDGGSEDAGITYSLSGTDAAGFSISATGELNFNSAPDFDSPTDDNANNIYQLTITANDGEDSNHSTSQDITVVVYPENEETINGQVQLGVDIDGENSGDGFGASVSMSADGYTMAVGAPGNDDNGTGSGHVRVFTWNGSSWLQRGSDIDGESAGDGSGTSLSLSADGTILAIGAPNNDANGTFSGQVRVYFWDGSDWVQRGSDIDGEASADQSGSSVSLNADGTVLAIGAPNNDQNGADSGHVRVFTWDGSNWLQRGTAIGGESSGDRSGSSVSLSADGNMLAIGAPYNDGNGSNSGHTRVHNWNGSNWVQIGEDIDGEASGDLSGGAVSMDAPGENVAIGARGNDSFRGHARVFRWNSSGSWIQVFSDVNGSEEGDELGCSVSLSADGQVLAVGARDDSNGLEPGFVRVYRVSLGWEQKGADIEGEAIGDWFGSSIGLSGDGSFLAIGAQRNDDNGSSAGHIRTYQLVDKSPVITSSDEVSFSENGTGTVIDVDGNDGDLGSVDTNITYSLTAGGDNDLFSISSTGLITFNATPDFESPQDADTDNIYEIEVNVADASNTTTQTVTVTVTDVDDEAPVFSSNTTTSFEENATGTVYTAMATDADSENITYELSNSHETDVTDLFNLDSNTGVLTFVNAQDYEEGLGNEGEGTEYEIDITASDNAGNETTLSLTVSLRDINDAANFVSNPVTTINDNETYEYLGYISDPDNESIYNAYNGIQALELPSWLQFEFNNPIISSMEVIDAEEDGEIPPRFFMDTNHILRDSQGNVFLHYEDRDFSFLAKIDPSGNLSYVSLEDADGLPFEIELVPAMAIDSQDNIYFAMFGEDDFELFKISTEGVVTPVNTDLENASVNALSFFPMDMDFNNDETALFFVEDDGEVHYLNLTTNEVQTVGVESPEEEEFDKALIAINSSDEIYVYLFKDDEIPILDKIDSDLIGFNRRSILDGEEVSELQEFIFEQISDMLFDSKDQLLVASFDQIWKFAEATLEFEAFPISIDDELIVDSFGFEGVNLLAEFNGEINYTYEDGLGYLREGTDLFIETEDPLSVTAVDRTIAIDGPFDGSINISELERLDNIIVNDEGQMLLGIDGSLAFILEEGFYAIATMTDKEDGEFELDLREDDVTLYGVSNDGDFILGIESLVLKVSSTDLVDYAAAIDARERDVSVGFTKIFEAGEGLVVSVLLDSENKLFVNSVSFDGSGPVSELIKVDLATEEVSFPINEDSPFFDEPEGEAALFFLDMVIDESDNIYLADPENDLILKLDAQGDLTKLAELVEVQFLSRSSNNLYAATSDGLYLINSDGTVILMAGGVATDTSVDGTGDEARFAEINNIFVSESEGLIYILDEGIARQAQFNSIDFRITGNPEGQVGTHDVALFLKDVFETEELLGETQEFTITVLDATAPVITSEASLEIPENTNDVILAVTATDTNPSAILSFSISGTDASKFNIDSETGELGFVSSPDFENPEDEGANNSYVITVTVADDAENESVQELTVTVTDLNDELPVITSDGGGESASLSIVENIAEVTTVTATDADANSTISYSISGGVDQALFEINNGVLAFTSAPDFEHSTDDDANNTYVVEVSASDGTNEDVQTITVTVTDVDEIDPVFTSATAVNFAENGNGVVYTALATDAGRITYNLGTSLDEEFFNMDPSNGEVTFKNAPDFENPQDADFNNSYILIIKATDDAGNESSLEITVQITDVEEIATAPILVSSDPVDGATEFSGSTITLTFDAVVTKGTGVIQVNNAVDDATVFEIGVNHPDVVINGSSVSIGLGAALPVDIGVYLQIPGSAFKGTQELFYAGMSDKTTLNFSTPTSPVLVSSTPSDDGADFDGTTIDLIFDREMFKGTGVVGLFDAEDDSEVWSAGVNSSKVAITGNTVSFNVGTLASDNAYYINIASSALKDAGGLFYAGISDKSTLNFSTPTSPVLVSSTPSDDDVDFDGTTIDLIFDREMFKGTGVVGLFDAEDDSEVWSVGVNNGNVTINGSTVSLNVGSLSADKAYYLNIGANALKDTNGKSYAGISVNSTLNFSTPTSPVLLSSDPMDDAVNFSGTSISLTFDSNMSKGTGVITLFDAADDSQVWSAGVNNPNVAITGTTVTLNTGDLPLDKDFYLNVAGTAFKDAADLFYQGISDKTTLNFSGRTTPQLLSSTPADNATGYGGTTVSLSFDRNLVKGTGVISLKNQANDSDIWSVGVLHPDVTITGSTVTLNVGNLPLATAFYVNISPTAFKDAGNLFYPGITDKTTLNFTGVSRPVLLSSSPVDGATGFNGASIVLTFDKPVIKGAGVLALFDAADDSQLWSKGINNANISINGATVTLNTGALPLGRNVYLNIAATAFKDANNLFYAGIADKTTLNFSTGSSGGGSPAAFALAGEVTIETKGFTVYPNPSSKEVTIDLSQLGAAPTVIITDMSGMEVFRRGNVQAGRLKVDVSQYGQGVYLVSVVTETGAMVRKKLSVVR